MVKDKIILITGGNTGIGAASAKLLAQNGARIIINYRENEESANSLAKEIHNLTGNENSACALKADVANEEEVSKLVKLVLDKYGKIDVLINNASPQTLPKSFIDTSWQEFDKLLSVNVKGAYNLTQAVLPNMLEQKQGVIINVLTSYVINAPPTKLAPYITAKHALEGFSKSLAAEFGPSNIRVNMVSPGVTKTKFTEHLPERMFELISVQTPLRKIADPEDVAKVLLFLSSEDSCHLTGVNIPVCGGIVMQ